MITVRKRNNTQQFATGRNRWSAARKGVLQTGCLTQGTGLGWMEVMDPAPFARPGSRHQQKRAAGALSFYDGAPRSGKAQVVSKPRVYRATKTYRVRCPYCHVAPVRGSEVIKVLDGSRHWWWHVSCRSAYLSTRRQN